jgi:hypothetical protein
VSWTTNFIVTNPTNPEAVFLAVRRLAGIPGEHPFTIRTDAWDDTQIISQPGYFDATIIVWHHNGLPITIAEEDDENCPVAFVRVAFDTSYGYEGPEGDGADLHRQITTELGAWCDQQGLSWATSDERDCGRDQGWREHTPAFVD